jgi:hypothetical protein
LHRLAAIGSDAQTAQSDMANFPPDLLSERKDYAFVRPNLVDTEHAIGARSACSDAGNVTAAAQNVRTDMTLLQGDRGTFNDDARRVERAITQLGNDEATLRRGIKKDGYTPASAPTAAAVDSEISVAQTELATSRLTIAGYFRKANHLVAVANGFAKHAQAICARA